MQGWNDQNKNVDVDANQLNNIVFKKIQFYNNSCGSGCLVISQQDDITFPSRRELQTLHQGIFNEPFTVLLRQSSFMINTALNGIIVVSNLSLSVLDSKFIKNIGFNISGGILFLGNKNHNFQIVTSEISDSIGNKGGAMYLNNKTISNTELIQVLFSSNKATSFGQDLVDIAQELTISIDKGKTLLNRKFLIKGPKTVQEIVIKPIQYQVILHYNNIQLYLQVKKLETMNIMTKIQKFSFLTTQAQDQLVQIIFNNKLKIQKILIVLFREEKQLSIIKIMMNLRISYKIQILTPYKEIIIWINQLSILIFTYHMTMFSNQDLIVLQFMFQQLILAPLIMQQVIQKIMSQDLIQEHFNVKEENPTIHKNYR